MSRHVQFQPSAIFSVARIVENPVRFDQDSDAAFVYEAQYSSFLSLSGNTVLKTRIR